MTYRVRGSELWEPGIVCDLRTFYASRGRRAVPFLVIVTSAAATASAGRGRSRRRARRTRCTSEIGHELLGQRHHEVERGRAYRVSRQLRFLDPARPHLAARSLVSREFTAWMVAWLEPWITEVADQLVARARDLGSLDGGGRPGADPPPVKRHRPAHGGRPRGGPCAVPRLVGDHRLRALRLGRIGHPGLRRLHRRPGRPTLRCRSGKTTSSPNWSPWKPAWRRPRPRRTRGDGAAPAPSSRPGDDRGRHRQRRPPPCSPTRPSSGGTCARIRSRRARPRRGRCASAPGRDRPAPLHLPGPSTSRGGVVLAHERVALSLWGANRDPCRLHRPGRVRPPPPRRPQAPRLQPRRPLLPGRLTGAAFEACILLDRIARELGDLELAVHPDEVDSFLPPLGRTPPRVCSA